MNVLQKRGKAQIQRFNKSHKTQIRLQREIHSYIYHVKVRHTKDKEKVCKVAREKSRIT